ncbi:MAG TPA: guanylate kinase [Candidatus Limnocylindrales bacterium]|nr:guanylate kinase [Candidatus Limnocylindrales bacterium]
MSDIGRTGGARPPDAAASGAVAGVSAPGTGDGAPAPTAAATRALLVIISGPSGVGKDTIIAAMRRRHRDRDYHYVVTCTTRARRPGEVDGVSYHFLTPERFAELRAAGEFLEANEVHGHWYGTPRAQVREALADGRDVILKIDVQGAQVVKETVPDALLIFLVPPSQEDLFHRLRSRATESVDELELRQRNAAVELARADDYDYVVTNETGQVERTAERIDEIIGEEHRRTPPRRVRV